MTREWRLLVRAGEPGTVFTATNGAITVPLKDHDWVLIQSSEEIVRAMHETIRTTLPDALNHITLQIRDVTEWNP